MNKEHVEDVDVVDVGKTERFTERFAESVVVSHSYTYFIFDFLKPDASLVARRDTGAIVGLRGSLKSDVRIFLSPPLAKKLLNILSDQIKKYEEKYGKIKLEEELDEELREE